MRLRTDEPSFGPWQAVSASDVVAALQRHRSIDRPLVVAVDGRGGSGKTTTADILRTAANEAGERAVLLSTDDIAWSQARFDWDYLLADHVLSPARAATAVCWRPPAWISGGRECAIEVLEGTTMLFVEGTGAARRQLVPLLDFTRQGLEFHQAGFKLNDVCRYYWQSRDRKVLQELRSWDKPERYQTSAQETVSGWEVEAKRLDQNRTGAHGLYPQEQYCGDIHTPVQTLNASSKAWRSRRSTS